MIGKESSARPPTATRVSCSTSATRERILPICHRRRPSGYDLHSSGTCLRYALGSSSNSSKRRLRPSADSFAAENGKGFINTPRSHPRLNWVTVGPYPVRLQLRPSLRKAAPTCHQQPSQAFT
jgi:hypothetical protein